MSDKHLNFMERLTNDETPEQYREDVINIYAMLRRSDFRGALSAYETLRNESITSMYVRGWIDNLYRLRRQCHYVVGGLVCLNHYAGNVLPDYLPDEKTTAEWERVGAKIHAVNNDIDARRLNHASKKLAWLIVHYGSKTRIISELLGEINRLTMMTAEATYRIVVKTYKNIRPYDGQFSQPIYRAFNKPQQQRIITLSASQADSRFLARNVVHLLRGYHNLVSFTLYCGSTPLIEISRSVDIYKPHDTEENVVDPTILYVKNFHYRNSKMKIHDIVSHGYVYPEITYDGKFISPEKQALHGANIYNITISPMNVRYNPRHQNDHLWLLEASRELLENYLFQI